MQRAVAIIIILIFIMSVIFWVSSSSAYAARDDSECAICHSDDVDEAKTRLFVHAPFRDGKCGACHVSNAGTSQAASAEAQDYVSEPDPLESPEKIASVDVDWLYEYFEPVQNLLLPLSRAEVEKMLVVELWDQCRGEHQHVVPLPPLHQVPELPGQTRGARGDVQIHSMHIARDPHYPDTIVVECRTSVPVRGEILLHGDDGRERSVQTPQGYHSRMEMRINGLKSNTRYELEFRYRSVDGTAQRSPLHVFIPAQLEPQTQNDTDADCELKADIGVYQGKCDDSDTCYFLRIAANQPITLSVGALKAGVELPGHLRNEFATAASEGEENNPGEPQGSRFHSDLAGGYFTNYAACRPCHSDFFGPMSHPVDIVPGVGMDVSPELPLLEDGRISCMTCHVFHGGNDHYRLRFGAKKELCHACHDEY